MMASAGSRLRRFAGDPSGAATVEYVIIFVPLMAVIFFVFQTALAYHWALSAQKAVEQGARVAAVRAPVVAELTRDTGLGPKAINRTRTAGGERGGPCYLGNCEPVGTMSCSGGERLTENPGVTCDAARFNAIFDVVDNLAYGVRPEDVTITYEDLDMGFADTPYVSVVTVSIRRRAFPLATGIFGSSFQIPFVSASLVAEDLSG